MNYGNQYVRDGVSYTCRITPLGKLPTLAIAFGIGMTGMYIAIFLSLPVWAIMLGMLGSMYGIMFLLTKEAEFVLGKNEISRLFNGEVKRFNTDQEKTYLISQIGSYQSGSDRGRYRGEFQYLRIYFVTGEQWELTDMYGERKAAYDAFLRAFLDKVEGHNRKIQTPQTDVAAMPEAVVSPPGQKASSRQEWAIERRKTFYEKPIAKVMTLLLTVFVGALMYFLLRNPKYIQPTHYFKFVVVLLPGIGYLWYRVFGEKRND